uniref:Uncharacterized protein n=1 Tax=Romanomermis culicivorax TaxID=13658 RepID=A0A915IRX8_ROMCU
MLPPPIFLVPGCFGVTLAAQPTPNFWGCTLVHFNTESIMAGNMKNFKFAVTMPADSTASSYPRDIQLAFLSGTMFVFETLAVTLEDWTALFSLVDGQHTILISFDGGNDWAGIYALLSYSSAPIIKRRIKILYGFIPKIYNTPLLYQHDSLEELGIADALQTAHFALFLYEARGLDNPSCPIQAYNTTIGLIDCWMAYPQYSPFRQPPEIGDIHHIYPQYHSETDRLVPLLRWHDFSTWWNLLLPCPLLQTGLPSDHLSLVPLPIPPAGLTNFHCFEPECTLHLLTAGAMPTLTAASCTTQGQTDTTIAMITPATLMVITMTAIPMTTTTATMTIYHTTFRVDAPYHHNH